MDFAEQLRVLQAAEGNPAKLALATVDLAFPELPDADRTALKEALEAAAIPHWCDPRILATLMQITPEESEVRFARLRKLTVIEPFPARGEGAVNVHEAARLAVRKWLAADHSDSFRTLSQRAAEHFQSDRSPASEIEWIYHRLCAAPDEGATELERLDRDWCSSARPEDHQALAVAMRELEETSLATGRAQVWILLSISWARVSRGETSQLGPVAIRVLDLARVARDARAEADAQCLIGDVLVTQGKLAEAQAAYAEFLAISRRLAAQDPDNAGWQRELAVAHSKVGDVLEAQGKLVEARAAFAEVLEISRRLAAQEPGNAGWQHDLAVAHSRVGGVLEAQGKLAEAQVAFAEYLAISRRLVAQDPDNAGWQRELAVAHSRVGGVLQAQGKLAEAQAAFAEDLAISRRLAAQDPSNAGWQRDLAVAHLRLARLKTGSGQLTERIDHLQEAQRIFERLVAGTPDHPGWRDELGVVTYELAAAEALRPRAR